LLQCRGFLHNHPLIFRGGDGTPSDHCGSPRYGFPRGHCQLAIIRGNARVRRRESLFIVRQLACSGLVSSCRNLLFLGADPTGLDCIQKSAPIALRLVGVSHREFRDRFVELAILAQIAGESHRVSCAGMSARQCVAA